MASRSFYQQLFSLNPDLTFLECNFVVGSTGAVGTTKGSGIKSIVRQDVGTYQINLTDSYNRYLGGDSGFVSPLTGSATDPHSEATGHVYVITTVGNTDWTSAGLPAGVTPAVGVAFALTAQPAAGTGRVKAVSSSGINAVEVIGDSNLTCSNPTNPYLIVQCLGPTDATHTAQIPVDPAAGSVMGLTFFFRNSSLKGKGE